jgi:hypothetical protein
MKALPLKYHPSNFPNHSMEEIIQFLSAEGNKITQLLYTQIKKFLKTQANNNKPT